MKTKKIVMRSLLWLAVLLAVVLVLLVFWGGAVVRHSVNMVGPRILGVPVVLEQARFKPLQGQLSLSGLTVGNPEGFRTENLFYIRHLEVQMQMRSLFADALVIERILVDAPQITYEIGIRSTNLGTLLKNLEAEAPPPGEQPDALEKQPGKPLIIKELEIADARVQVSATAMLGHVVPIELSTITLNDLGGEDQRLRQMVTEVLKALMGAVGHAMSGAGDLLGSGLQSAIEGVGALGGHAAGVTTEGARAVGGAAAGGARAVGGAVGSGFQGVRGLLGGKDAAAGEAEADHGINAGTNNEVMPPEEK